MKNLVLALLAAISISGCPKPAGPPVAGQPVNDFEKYAYTVLYDVQVGLNETAKKIQSGELPQSIVPDYDRAAVLYNTAKDLLTRYDATYRAGNDVSAIQAELAGDLADLISLGAKLYPQRATAPPPPKR